MVSIYYSMFTLINWKWLSIIFGNFCTNIRSWILGIQSSNPVEQKTASQKGRKPMPHPLGKKGEVYITRVSKTKMKEVAKKYIPVLSGINFIHLTVLSLQEGHSKGIYLYLDQTKHSKKAKLHFSHEALPTRKEWSLTFHEWMSFNKALGSLSNISRSW